MRGRTVRRAAGRSVSEPSSEAFHSHWAEHRAGVLEFAFERQPPADWGLFLFRVPRCY